MKVAVVGGGPAGLTTLKFLATAHTFFPIPPLQVRLFESEDDIGGTFVHRVYEDAELVSSKYLTAFSDFRIPSDAPDFITPQAYVQYLRNYIAHFNLQPYIHTNSRITRITRRKTSPSSYSSASSISAGQQKQQQHVIEITSPDGIIETWHCDAVAICTGINVHPRIPVIPGMGRIPVAIHSSNLKTRAQFGTGTHVLILGAGETGMDIAHLAVTAPTASIIPTPTPRGQATKVGTRPNKPVDTSVASLFDTAYAHPVLQRSPLLWFVYDVWVRKMHWFISGTEEGPDQWVGHMSKERKHLDSCKYIHPPLALSLYQNFSN
ncbi:hypothetical protein NQ176_g1816 [Zarea fungicola]|uniref:Uncharacterized protein n=1 Tax=Zarea fungicola TaxID=93591 RepID=A0ACC1NS75_9HYPO|nr:hypothetical protein NQ176_g1816 [Lecanicillium fungicola]